MSMIQKALALFICLSFVYAFFQGAVVEANKISLPKTVEDWSRPESPQIIDSSNIFKYMNGAGELYLGYRFNHLEVFDYTSENQDNILVELYFMETPDDAFGLLSLDWGGEPVDLNHSSKNKATHSVAPIEQGPLRCRPVAHLVRQSLCQDHGLP